MKEGINELMKERKNGFHNQTWQSESQNTAEFESSILKGLGFYPLKI